MPTQVSFKAEVIADKSGKWSGNQLRFATQKEAADYVQNLMWRWTAVRETRVLPSTDAVNARYVNGKTEPCAPTQPNG